MHNGRKCTGLDQLNFQRLQTNVCISASRPPMNINLSLITRISMVIYLFKKKPCFLFIFYCCCCCHVDSPATEPYLENLSTTSCLVRKSVGRLPTNILHLNIGFFGCPPPPPPPSILGPLSQAVSKQDD